MNGKRAKQLRRNAIGHSWQVFYSLLSKEEWEKLTFKDIKPTTYTYNRVGPLRKIQVKVSPPCPRFYYNTEKKIYWKLKHKA